MAVGVDVPLGLPAMEPGVGEVKRMFVLPAARGRGIGWSLLAKIEEQAHVLGVSRLVLETGERQQEAFRLYQAAGYCRIDRFGEYVDSPLSVCLGKTLRPATEC